VRSRSFLVSVESPDRNRSRGSFFFTVLGELDTIATGVTRHHHRRLYHPAVYLTVAPAAAALRHPRQRCRPRRRRPHLRRRDVLAAPPTAPSPTASPHRRRPRFSPPTSRSPSSARCARRARCSPRPRPALPCPPRPRPACPAQPSSAPDLRVRAHVHAQAIERQLGDIKKQSAHVSTR